MMLSYLHSSMLKHNHLQGSLIKHTCMVPCYVSLNKRVLADCPWGGPKARRKIGVESVADTALYSVEGEGRYPLEG